MTGMGKNWVKVCKKLLPNTSDELTLADERKALQIIEKNIYHKRPSIMPITIHKVSFSHYTLIRCFMVWSLQAGTDLKGYFDGAKAGDIL